MKLNYKILNWVLYLSWDKCLDAHHYRIMALSHTFVYYTVDTTREISFKLPVDKYSSYIRFKVVAESVNGDKLAESNEVNISYLDIEKFEITALSGYRGTTLAFRSKWVYDLYKVYDEGGLIAETEDPVLELLYKMPKTKLNEIIVEWYIKKDDQYILWWISEGIAKLPERKKSKYKISVVIPIYNVQFFLSRTIDSILSSSMSDIEIILVDDGSTDESRVICDWYVKNFPCVSVIHQKNQWVSVARNNWVNEALGEYVGFPDSDDIIHPFMYENLYKACKTEKTDIAIAITIIHNDIDSKEYVLSMPGKKDEVVVYTYDEMIKNKHNRDNMYYVSSCNKIVKTEVARQVQFPTKWPTNVILYEDSAYTATLYSYIDRFALSKNAYYIYDKRKQNTVGSYSVMYKNESTDDVRKAFIYAYSYPIYNRNKKHKELGDYTNFQRLIESYDKFDKPCPLLDYWNEKLKEVINKQKLYENRLIMNDKHLKDVVNKLID